MEFDKSADKYNSILNKAIRFSGYEWDYFARYKAKWVSKVVASPFRGRILDFGCGVGNLVGIMRELFPEAQIDGFDVSTISLEKIHPDLRVQGKFTANTSELRPSYDLIVAANVFHHILPRSRLSTINMLYQRLSPQGQFIIIEHNPYNPLTCLSVHYSPLDHEAIIASSSEMIGYLKASHFNNIRRSYIVFFPKYFSWLTPLESFLGWLPLGAQYALWGSKIC